MKIDWKKRFSNKVFWLSMIPAMLLLIQAVLAIFGIDFDFTKIQEQLLLVVNALFAVLVLLGIVVDPTTEGLSDD